MRRLSLIALAGLLALALLTAANTSGNSGRASASPIIIGHAAGLTGFMRPYDYGSYLGAQIAVADINKKGGVLGRPLKLIVADTKSDKVQAGTAAAVLLDRGAKFILAPDDFDFGAAAAVEAQKRKVVGISPGAGVVQFGAQGIGPFAYTLGNSAAGYSTAAAEWAYRVKHWRRVYILQDDTIEFSKQSCAAFAARWKKFGGASVTVFDHISNSYGGAVATAQITRMQQSHPDFIFMSAWFPVLRQMVSAGVSPTIPVVGAGQLFDGEFWKPTVPNASNLFYPSLGLIDGRDPRPIVNRLMKLTRPKLKDLTSTFVVYGYSAVEAIAKAIRKAHSTDGPAVVKALNSFRNVPLAVGKTTFTPRVHIALSRRVAILQVQKGRTTFVRFWTPQNVPPQEEWGAGG
jgi:branched-chain amino acid transport system substrate-binding protein